jgi:mRNA interferase RelE/StbE
VNSIQKKKQKKSSVCKMYKLEFEKRALHDLNRLDKPIKERIWNKLQDTKEDPFRYFEKLVETEGFKLRIGGWRVIADIDRSVEKIMVLKVGHRKNIYEK